MRLTLLLLVVLSVLPFVSVAKTRSLYSINTGSFIHHVFPENSDSTQGFDNHYFSIERKLGKDSDVSVLAGSFLNSQNNRCILLGLRKDWYRVNPQLVIKGVYSYAGEFFFDAFADCGDEGVYRTVKEDYGVAFAPYIYHGAQYNFTDYFGLEGGIILPGILLISMQWSF